jgi:hypothetical protein
VKNINNAHGTAVARYCPCPAPTPVPGERRAIGLRGEQRASEQSCRNDLKFHNVLPVPALPSILMKSILFVRTASIIAQFAQVSCR